MKKMSIKDIAAAFNISNASVSYILNGKAKEKRITDELAEKVQQFANDNNYQPNQLAQSLRTGKTNIICLMVEDIADPFFAGVAGYIETIAYEKGYTIINCSTKNSTKKAKELIDAFKMRNVDGFIITPPAGIEDDIRNLIAERVPTVLFDRYLEKVKASYVGMDNYESSFNAVEYLYKQGYKNIVCVTLDSIQMQMTDRLNGYKNAVKQNKKKPVIKQIHYSFPIKKTVVTDIVELLNENPATDAIFFTTNYLALSGIEALSILKKEIGRDIGIVAFDDNDLFRIHKPSITAVAQPVEKMAGKLINMLLEKIKAPEENILQTAVIPATLAVRASSKK